MDITKIELTLENILKVWPTLNGNEQKELFKKIGQTGDKTLTIEFYKKVGMGLVELLTPNEEEKTTTDINNMIKKMSSKGKSEAEIKEKIIEVFERQNGCKFAVKFHNGLAFELIKK